MNAHTFVSKEGSIVWAMLRSPKGIISIGKFRSVKRAEARCIEWANAAPTTQFVGRLDGQETWRAWFNDSSS
jgi:hypothetical protein